MGRNSPETQAFAALLKGHLRRGTRPSTLKGEPWTYAEFSAEVISSRDASQERGVSARSVSNWCSSVNPRLPVAIEPILRALFGPPESQRHSAAREELREAFLAARDAEAKAWPPIRHIDPTHTLAESSEEDDDREQVEPSPEPDADDSSSNPMTPKRQTVFLSYAHESAVQARAAVRALQADGHQVWIDESLSAHGVLSREIEQQITDAAAVLVLWSVHAVQSEWVIAEAQLGRRQNKLVQARLDNVNLPLPHEARTCADLTGWSGDTDAREWKRVLDSIHHVMGPRASQTSDAEDRRSEGAGSNPRSGENRRRWSKEAQAELDLARERIAGELAKSGLVLKLLVVILGVTGHVDDLPLVTARTLVESGPRNALRSLKRVKNQLFIGQSPDLAAIAITEQIIHEITLLAYDVSEIEDFRQLLMSSSGLIADAPAFNLTAVEIVMAKINRRRVKLGPHKGKEWREGVNLIPLPPETGPEGFDRFTRAFDDHVFARTLNSDELDWTDLSRKRERANEVIGDSITDVDGSLYFVVNYKIHRKESEPFTAFIREFQKVWPSIHFLRLSDDPARDREEVLLLRAVLDILPVDRTNP